MNPGMANIPLRLRREAATVLDTGERAGTWAEVAGGPIWARRMKPRALAEATLADRPTERRALVFRVRSRPFLTLYEKGDRFSEPARTTTPAAEWEITGFSEVEVEGGEWVDVMVEELERN